MSVADATGTSSFTYDARGNLLTEVDGGGDSLGYAYDAVGQLTSLTDWLDNESTFTWTVDGQLDTQTSGNGVVQSRDYDSRGHLTDIGVDGLTASLAPFAYGFDAVGQLASTETTLDGQDVDRAFEYDPLSQLNNVATTVSTTTTSEDYNATSAGLVTEIVGGRQLTYNTAQQLVSIDAMVGADIEFSYDTAGRRTSSTSTTYGYDAAGYLASVITPTATVGYTTDARGLRQTRTEGSTTDDLLWSTVGGLPLLLDDGDHSYIYGPTSTPIAQIDDSGTVEYLQTDLLGSVRLITDEDGDAVGTSTFDEFGTRVNHTGTAETAFGYTGAWTDTDTGLVHLRARDYDPATGQFLTVDPAVDQTRQPYAYVGNNPLTRTDPTGLDWWGDWGAFAGGYLDRSSMGVSSQLFGAVNPGWDCFTSSNSSSFEGGRTVVDQARANLASLFVGLGDGASGWLTEEAREAIAPGSTSTIDKNGFYSTGAAIGFVGGLATGAAAFGLATKVVTRAEAIIETASSVSNKFKTITSLAAHADAHVLKLEQYLANPLAQDNLGILAEAIRIGDTAREASIMAGRVHHLQKEVSAAFTTIERLMNP